MLHTLYTFFVEGEEPTVIFAGRRRSLRRVLIAASAILAIVLCAITGAPFDD